MVGNTENPYAEDLDPVPDLESQNEDLDSVPDLRVEALSLLAMRSPVPLLCK